MCEAVEELAEVRGEVEASWGAIQRVIAWVIVHVTTQAVRAAVVVGAQGNIGTLWAVVQGKLEAIEVHPVTAASLTVHQAQVKLSIAILTIGLQVCNSIPLTSKLKVVAGKVIGDSSILLSEVHLDVVMSTKSSRETLDPEVVIVDQVVGTASTEFIAAPVKRHIGFVKDVALLCWA